MIKAEKANGRRALLLVENEKLFTLFKQRLEEAGWEVEDFIYLSQECDLAMVDSYYYEAGTAEYLKEQNAERPVCLAATEREILRRAQSKPFAEMLDDILIVYANRNSEAGFTSVRYGETPLNDYLEKVSLINAVKPADQPGLAA